MSRDSIRPVTERIIIALAFAAVFMLTVHRPGRPLFMGEFNSIDGSLYWARAADAALAFAVFYVVSFTLVRRYLDRGHVFGFVIASAVLIGAASAIDLGIDRLLLSVFNLPLRPGEVSDTMIANPVHESASGAMLPKNLVAGGLGILYGMSRDWVMRHRAAERVPDATRGRVSFIRAQINPYLFFNSLNSVYAITQRNDDGEAGRAIVRLSELMRFMMCECEADHVPLSRELETIESLIDVCQLQYGREDDLDIAFSKRGHLNGYDIAPLLLLPFVENALKHGLDGKGRGWVRIAVETDEGLLRFSVENSKFPMRGTVRQHSGVGLAYVKRRLELLYPRRHELRIDETEDIYRVDLVLEIEG